MALQKFICGGQNVQNGFYGFVSQDRFVWVAECAVKKKQQKQM